MASGKERHSSNTLEKFYITVRSESSGKMGKKEVDGYRVSIPDCPEAMLFVHEALDKPGTWCVTEETSGYQLCEGASKPAAVGKARRMITEKYDKFVIAAKAAAKESASLLSNGKKQ